MVILSLFFRSSLIVATCVAGIAAHAQPASLTLDAFLAQVRAKNDAVRGAFETSEGAWEHSKEGSNLIAPTFFADVQLASDAKLPQIPVFSYDRIIENTYQLGISQLTTFGLQASLHYDVMYTSFVNPVVPGTTPGAANGDSGFSTQYHDAHPTIELTQDLWSNGFGRSTRANQELLEAQALATHFNSRYQGKSAMVDGEVAYWRLAIARQAVEVQGSALDRAAKIYDWASRRSRLELSDQADKLQASAALESRRLDLQSAQDEERLAARAFNLARGSDSEVVPERLESLSQSAIEALTAPARAQLRDDVRAAREQARAAEANAAVSIERNQPTLQAFASYSMNGRQDGLIDTVDDSFSSGRPTEAIGLRFSMPLDVGTLSRSRDGWQREREGSNIVYQRKLLEQEAGWKDLNDRFQQAKTRLKLARTIEQAQNVKLEYEKKRQSRGRSTTYQVLLFEQDYLGAVYQRIRAESDVLTLLAQMKLYGEGELGSPTRSDEGELGSPTRSDEGELGSPTRGGESS